MKKIKPFFDLKNHCIGVKIGDMEYYLDFWSHPSVRFLGYRSDWYDGPMKSFGFWFMHLCWHHHYE